MVNLRNYIYNLRQAIFHRSTTPYVEDGISYKIGTGSYDPYPRPQMVYHWHPPLTTLKSEKSGKDTHKLRDWIMKVGIWKKSA